MSVAALHKTPILYHKFTCIQERGRGGEGRGSGEREGQRRGREGRGELGKRQGRGGEGVRE